MAIENAREFVKKFFEDDEFIKKIYEMGALKPDKKSDDTTNDEYNRRIVEAANELGYDFNDEEFKSASKEYSQELGGWKTFKTIMHMGKVVNKLEKESKKKNQ